MSDRTVAAAEAAITRPAAAAAENGVQAIVRDYSQFERIAADKRERILAAALKEFAEFDYYQVSTNSIIKRAGISKGLLFHYFGDKAGLFCYLLDSITAKYTNEVLELVGMNTEQPNDVFDVLRLSVNAKLDITRRYVLETCFIIRAVKGNLPPALKDYVTAWYMRSYEMMGDLANSLDQNLLKDGIDRKRAAKIIEWSCEGMTTEILESVTANLTLEDFQLITKDVTEYIDFMRDLFYKK